LMLWTSILWSHHIFLLENLTCFLRPHYLQVLFWKTSQHWSLYILSIFFHQVLYCQHLYFFSIWLLLLLWRELIFRCRFCVHSLKLLALFLIKVFNHKFIMSLHEFEWQLISLTGGFRDAIVWSSTTLAEVSSHLLSI
jgi:hypothetical protein